MQIFAGIPSHDADNSNCPEEFQPFFFADMNPSMLCKQDEIHIIVKLFSRFMLYHRLRIGNHFISRTFLEKILEKGPVGKLKKSELTTKKDSMNFNIANKSCSSEIIQRLVHPDEYATQQFLTVMRFVIIAYIDVETEPLERIHKAWRTVFFLRSWKEAVVADKFTCKRDYYDKSTLEKSYVTRNVQVCIEINAHHLLLMLMRCRDMGIPECFLPYDANSQQCERKFADLRGMSTALWTEINFDLKTSFEKIRRLNVMDEIRHSLDGFEFADFRKQKSKFVPISLPTNQECADVIMKAWNENRAIFKNLGKCHSSFHII